jgi:energy-coupling factor transporter ATP-binding protein EcfA2
MTKELTVKNLYGIRGTITHRTDSNTLVITGENGAGKSSFVNSFLHVFAHKAVKDAPSSVHTGQIEGEVKYTDDDLGLSFSRRFKGGKMLGVEIRALDGAKYDESPAVMLKDRIGTVTVNVSEFLKSDEATRRDLIMAKSTFPEGFDLVALNAKQADIESRRTDAHRDKTRLEGVIARLVPPAKSTPDSEVDGAALLAEIAKAQDHNRAIEEGERRAASIQDDIDRREREIEQLLQQVATYRAIQGTLELSRAEAVASASAEPIDSAAIRTQYDDIETTNRAVREKLAFNEVKAEHDAAVAKHATLEADLKAVKKDKFDGLAKAVFPHPALSVNDDYVLVDGTPFISANSGAVSLVALAIAISGEHSDEELRLVILKDGDWLDSKSLAAADKMIADKGFFGLVDRGRPDMPNVPGIDVIELSDGQVAE